MLIGVVFGALITVIGIIMVAKRDSEFDRVIGGALALIRLHLGHASRIEADIDGSGWHVCVRCMNCGQRNRIKNKIAGAQCGGCHTPFKDSGNKQSGGGRSTISVNGG